MTTQTIATTTAAATATSKPRQRRAVNVALWVLQALTAAVFVFAALPKLTASPQAVEGFNALGLGVTGMYIIGALELAGAVALLIPRLCGLAGLAFVGLMVGAVITTAVTLSPAMVVTPAVVGVAAATIAWTRRHRTAELVALVRRPAQR